jgi:hypothetical protein
MTAHTALIVTSLVANLTFIALMVVAFFDQRVGATLRQLDRAVRLYGWAGAAEAAVLIVRLFDGAYGWALLAAGTAGIVFLCQHVTRQRRNLKADQVQAAAERTVQDWRG